MRWYLQSFLSVTSCSVEISECLEGHKRLNTQNLKSMKEGLLWIQVCPRPHFSATLKSRVKESTGLILYNLEILWEIGRGQGQNLVKINEFKSVKYQ
jgi:hypothetical protein